MVDTTPVGSPSADRASRARSRGRAHEAVRNAAIDMLREVGYHGLTFEGVAARAGAGKATLYRWWPTKAALVVDAITHRINLPPVKTTGDIRTDLRAVIQASYDALVRSALGTVLPALAVDLLQDPEAAQQLATYLQPRRDSVASIIDAAVARGDLRADVDARALLDIYAGAILYRSLISRDDSESIVDQLVELFLDGRLPRKADAEDHDGSGTVGHPATEM